VRTLIGERWKDMAMTSDGTSERAALGRWWKAARAAIAERGTPIISSELAGARVPIIALDLNTAENDLAVILDVLAPRLATWWTEESEETETEPGAYFIAFLSGETWHVVECGVAVDPQVYDEDEDNDGAYPDLTPSPEIEEAVRRLASDAADDLLPQIAVADVHDRQQISGALSAGLRERILAAAPADERARYERATWTTQRIAADDLVLAVKRDHSRQIRVDAAKYAADLLASEPDLAGAAKGTRRDAVYHHMKAVDSLCVTRDSIQPVTSALEMLLAKKNDNPSLFE
jgi:hypothetical protein